VVLSNATIEKIKSIFRFNYSVQKLTFETQKNKKIVAQ